METLYVDLPSQVYAALQIPRCQGEWIRSGKTGTGKREAGGRAPGGLTGHRERTGRGRTVRLTGRDEGQVERRSKNHTAGRGCVGVRGFIREATEGG